jgi:NAD(P)-dependent dehydrogenase (short-subunit alcohol dehydrogenase family)
MIGLTKYFAAVGGPRGVRVNALSPGAFDNDHLRAGFRNNYCRRVYLCRLSRYDEIKGAVIFLASSAASYITGQNLIVDGGYTV